MAEKINLTSHTTNAWEAPPDNEFYEEEDGSQYMAGDGEKQRVKGKEEIYIVITYMP